MRTLSTLAAAIALTFLTACGGTDPGTGSRTLYVKAAMHSDGSTDGTRVQVELRENDQEGPVVTDAIVTLKGQSGRDQVLGLVGEDSRLGTKLVYARQGFAWDTGFVLQVRRADRDTLDATLEMPGATVITDPVSSTTFSRSRGERFVVRWRDEYNRIAQYPEVRLERADIRQTLNQDLTQFELDPSRLVPTQEEQVVVTRTNKVLLAGGLDGSEWTATTTHKVSFRVE